jgi:hypothetical protein
VILGGGRKYMFPKGTPDPEYPADTTQNGIRLDGRNLVQEWLGKHQVMGAPRGIGQGLGERLWVSELYAKSWLCPPGSPVCLEPHSADAGFPGPISDPPHG